MGLGGWGSFEMLLAIRQDRLGFLLIDQIKSKVGGNIAEREGHQGPLLQAVIHAFGVGIRNVIRKRNLDDPIRLSSLQLFTPKLQADERSQMKQIGVRDGFADGTAKRLGVGGVSNRQVDLLEPLCRRSWQRSLHRELRYRSFFIHEPKKRQISAAPFAKFQRFSIF